MKSSRSNKLDLKKNNISEICGRYDAANRKRLLKKTERTLASHNDDLQKLIALGFTATNISSLLHGAGPGAEEAITALTSEESIALFKDLILSEENPGGIFTPQDITSLLNNSCPRINEAIRGLAGSRTAFDALIGARDKPGMFTASNISSILHGAGLNLAAAASALASEAYSLNTLIRSENNPNGFFTAENIASILHHTGAKAPEAVAALTSRETLAVFKKLIGTPNNHGIFTAENVYSILDNTGSDLATAIEAMRSRLLKLEVLCSKAMPSAIAAELNLVSAKNLGESIDHLYDTLLSTKTAKEKIAKDKNKPLRGLYLAIAQKDPDAVEQAIKQIKAANTNPNQLYIIGEKETRPLIFWGRMRNPRKAGKNLPWDAAQRDEKICRLLIEGGIDINAQLSNGRTALHVLAKNWDTGGLTILHEVATAADITVEADVISENQLTPLMEAIKEYGEKNKKGNKLSTIQSLLEYFRADVNITTGHAQGNAFGLAEQYRNETSPLPIKEEKPLPKKRALLISQFTQKNPEENNKPEDKREEADKLLAFLLSQGAQTSHVSRLAQSRSQNPDNPGR